MQSPASLHLLPITFSLLPITLLSVLMLSPLLVCSPGTSVTLDNSFSFSAPLLGVWNHPLSLFPLFWYPFHGFPSHHLFPFLSPSCPLYCVPHISIPLLSCPPASSFHLPGASPCEGPPLTPHCLHTPLSALSCVFFDCFQSCGPHPAVLHYSTPALAHALMGLAPMWHRMWYLSAFLGGRCCAGVLAFTFHPDTGNCCHSQQTQGSTGSGSTGRCLFVMEIILVD